MVVRAPAIRAPGFRHAARMREIEGNVDELRGRGDSCREAHRQVRRRPVPDLTVAIITPTIDVAIDR